MKFTPYNSAMAILLKAYGVPGRPQWLRYMIQIVLYGVPGGTKHPNRQKQNE